MADTEAVTRASAIAAIEHVAQNNCGSREREAEEMLVAAPAAVAQEPFAWHVCSVNADGSLSLEHAAQWEEAAHEHINDAITEHEIEGAGSWVVRPAYHRPQPSPSAPAAWIDASVELPKSGVIVLACYRNSLGKLRRIRAQWVAAKTQEAHPETDGGEDDEDADAYWTPEGWYECIDNWDEYSSVVCEGKVTHWMPLPPPPAAQEAQ